RHGRRQAGSGERDGSFTRVGRFLVFLTDDRVCAKDRLCKTPRQAMDEITARPSLGGSVGAIEPYVPRLRIASGLILFTFAATHFINHAFGLFSLDLMNEGQYVR